ncbi:MAG: hypothetical protein ACRDE8_05615, partial [Ginsengibacter sp.]
MPAKIILKTFLCTLFTSALLIKLTAQQKLTYREKLFLNQSPPSQSGNSPTIHHNSQHALYRTYDGTNNNISDDSKAVWGSVNIPLYRD